ncbi:quinone-dependent dihydroorotate dehydrogenase [Ornithinicoccus hortensis]|uniref:Dihydroorotate dehydrogenase (quinone) n=1 Tax=Ornithinicoccus hortensis TaxID=82346 RepID=A0A542YQQ0_9MICO|nr:quinone-dependent dihydroorotate dehydrogenase [Ornithinicoccus hortensis]TQL50244.1 dihydroorotate oxidase A [Ornithinicoccus hortensis]
MPQDLTTRALATGYARVARPVFFRAGGGDAETAHHRTVAAVGALGRSRSAVRLTRAALAAPSGDGPVELWGLRFPNRVGLAAGMDKNGVGVSAWGALGFGHIELGTVTALPQPGNPRPRLFRLPTSGGVINRMGFNNHGVRALAERLRAARAAGAVDIPVGVSIGKSKVTPLEDAVGDYLTSVDALAGLADYLAVNVSSPNTPGLRSLQDAGPLRELLAAVVDRADAPVLVKLAPDLTDTALDEALEVATGAGVAGIIATNTTLARDHLAPSDRPTGDREAGGLSGAPLTARALQVVRRVSTQTGLPVIGVGGIMTAGDAARMLDAGARLVQVYTGLIYAGPALVREIASGTRSGTR